MEMVFVCQVDAPKNNSFTKLMYIRKFLTTTHINRKLDAHIVD